MMSFRAQSRNLYWKQESRIKFRRGKKIENRLGLMGRWKSEDRSPKSGFSWQYAVDGLVR